ncbi:aconitate hydratase AcnA [Aurantimonas endophytica]|uniref:Aconitate hydratase n=1 Tax=Aurantimonas endophytica TaxID=1522175 RepID=A0A7W6MP53_9HYPH|nr:aconitate hydratase AcnA [Aurantimonas endophytica]MBB4002583.1 aconitate hydratase [Aurantimonas endophytica]MCO6403464.1 aconitate hydratase AcnA [Aurantimonas endophytica]
MPETTASCARLSGYRIADLTTAEFRLGPMADLPISARIVLENLLRHEADGGNDIDAVASEARRGMAGREIAFRPSRVIMQDYAGIPALIDLAALRDRVAAEGGDPSTINPRVPSDLVVDHSLLVHATSSAGAFSDNLGREYRDNAERYGFLKWAQQAFANLRIVPPGKGIVHQVNIEHLAEIVSKRCIAGQDWLIPDTLIGTDSHTTMVNGLGVLGWGVGGIEAEAVMLGEAMSMALPPVIGIRLTGAVPDGVLATDVALWLTEALRRKGVVGAILEFHGPGVAALPVPDRTTIANMAPEFGATSAFFPTDERTLDYLRLTGRAPEHVGLVERYLRANRLWPDPAERPRFADVLDFDLAATRRTVSGPNRPEQRRDLAEVPQAAREMASAITRGDGSVRDGDIVIAAITSCTNTSNPLAMIAAGLLARNARRRGLTVAASIKTSLAPGSRVVRDYLETAGLLEPLEALGFALVGYACTTCVGNSGDLDPALEQTIRDEGLCVAAVLSGNRNFEARIHSAVKTNFLASPPLVVAYALAGSVYTDLTREPLGHDASGAPVTLADIWPQADEIAAVLAACVTSDQFVTAYAGIFDGDAAWQALETCDGPLFQWSEASSYFRRPPFFDLPSLFGNGPILADARPLMILGDAVTTDHISPVGAIGADTPAGQYLESLGIARKAFNAYGARRGNHEVMARGTFANPRLRNAISDRSGGWTAIMPETRPATIFEASECYAARGEPTIIVAGSMYGAGSARDWAAKGTRLLGVRAVLAVNFERIHRSNLVRMGVMPLEFLSAADRMLFADRGDDRVSVETPLVGLAPGARLEASLRRADGTTVAFAVRLRADTAEELEYLKAGGILPRVFAATCPTPPEGAPHG